MMSSMFWFTRIAVSTTSVEQRDRAKQGNECANRIANLLLKSVEPPQQDLEEALACLFKGIALVGQDTFLNIEIDLMEHLCPDKGSNRALNCTALS